jgi:DNA-binding MarR family transcriptional regulator
VSRKAPPRPATAEQPPPLTVTRPELLRGGSDREFRTLVHSLLAFSARLETVRSGYGAILGVSGIQYTILISVRYLEVAGDVYVSTIAEHLHLSGAFVTVETGKLVELGLLSKQVDPKDRRRVRLRSTAKARKALGKLAVVQAQVNNSLFESLDAGDFEELIRIVGELVGCADRAVHLLRHFISQRASA